MKLSGWVSVWMNWPKISTEQRKYISSLVLMMLVGVAFIFIGNQDETMQKNAAVSEKEAVSADVNSFVGEKSLEEKLADILAEIDGVGQVWVEITWDSSETTEYAYDEQQIEKESYSEQEIPGEQPSNHEIQHNRSLAMVSKGQGNTEPVIVRKVAPEAVGVLVVAQGADNPRVEENLLQAVETLLGIARHKVIILPAEKGGKT